MRKIQSLLVATVMLGGGLVASVAPATAAPGYPGSVPTNCSGKALNTPREGRPARVRLKVSTGGNGAARGRVTFQYVRKSNRTVVREYRRSYFGPGRTKYRFDNLPAGRYRVKVFVNTRPSDSVYQNCKDRFNQKVRPR